MASRLVLYKPVPFVVFSLAVDLLRVQTPLPVHQILMFALLPVPASFGISLSLYHEADCQVPRIQVQLLVHRILEVTWFWRGVKGSVTQWNRLKKWTRAAYFDSATSIKSFISKRTRSAWLLCSRTFCCNWCRDGDESTRVYVNLE